MTFEGVFTTAFKKDLKDVNKKHPRDVKAIVNSIENVILVNPFNADTKQLQCFEHYRHRIGKYRIVFDFTDENTIVFLAVDLRASIYAKLRRRFNKC
ncbi:type II toxin-antitoxin system RelE/ParE family toxin [Methanolobus tindarius]|uniref:Cytotoxic translational repressor of toxin-antitoxin stability system n=1 Tax=Methanolobus tindarius DSM 2278 TaxID=1090322 RepID=W9DP04_METTI|nr:cytotoxic translational repressor of toxin-antitoxin stability system [Methanolobus tindarius DSM 2278]